MHPDTKRHKDFFAIMAFRNDVLNSLSYWLTRFVSCDDLLAVSAILLI